MPNTTTRELRAMGLTTDGDNIVPIATPKPRATLPEVWRLYSEMENIHDVGKAIGVTGETARKMLLDAGYRLKGSKWTPSDIQQLKDYYTNTDPKEFSLDVIAQRIGRTKAAVALKASRFGMGDFGRPKIRRKPAMKQNELPWRRWVKHEHPRGFAGGRHSESARRTIGEKSKRAWEDAKQNRTGLMGPIAQQRRSDLMSQRNLATPASNCYSRAKRGRRADLGETFFRSSWEANYARYLNLLVTSGDIVRWEYEPETFWFEKIKRGVRSYTPDFKVWPASGDMYFVELKGWMDRKSKTKLRRMAKYHPRVKVELVDEVRYRGIARTAGAIIPLWEGKR